VFTARYGLITYIKSGFYNWWKVFTARYGLITYIKPGFYNWWKVFTARYGLIPYIERIGLSVLCGSENRQRLLLYTSLTDWFL
jgi:hypothetical protein